MTPGDPAALTPLPEPTPRYWPWLMVLLLLALTPLPALLLLPGWLGLPRYEVADGNIVARSLGSRTVIPAGTPVEAGPVTLRGRISGTSMSGYVVGTFNSPHGFLRVYSDGSHAAGALLLATTPRPTLLTPADPTALLEAWRGGGSATFKPSRPARPDPWLLLVLLLLMPSLWVLLRRPRLSYRLVGDALEVRTAVSRTRFPLAETEAVLTAAPLELRTFGTARPGYYTGTFSTRAGTVQAAASQKAPAQALLLRRAGKTHYLTPARPEVVAGWWRGGLVIGSGAAGRMRYAAPGGPSEPTPFILSPHHLRRRRDHRQAPLSAGSRCTRTPSLRRLGARHTGERSLRRSAGRERRGRGSGCRGRPRPARLGTGPGRPPIPAGAAGQRLDPSRTPAAGAGGGGWHGN